MGSSPWFYFVPYDPDINRALRVLRTRELDAGRYRPAVRSPEFPIGPHSAAPGARHRSADEALEASGPTGTRSILDITAVGDRPGQSVVVPVPARALLDLYHTTEPTHAMVESNWDVFEGVERGQGVYVIVYEGGVPAEIFFAGYSFD